MPHHWTPNDDLVAYYLYRYGESGLGLSLDEIGALLGMGGAALRMRIQNHKAVAGEAGLSNYSRLTEEVFRRCEERTEADLVSQVNLILER